MKIAILICLLTCSPACGQFTVTERSSFVVTERVEPEPLDDEFYAVMFTAKWCGPCQAYKTSGKLDRLMKRMATTVVDIDEHPEWKKQVSIIPTFWLARRSTQTRVKSWTGSTSIETIETEIKRIRLKPITATKADTGTHQRNQSLFGRIGTSHESRETLIRHLVSDGIHRGRWQMADLNLMSDDSLNDAHNNDHGW